MQCKLLNLISILFYLFGTMAFILNKKKNRGKLEPKAEAGIFLGYSDVSKAYRIWIPRSREVVISRVVKVIGKISINQGKKHIVTYNSIKTMVI